MTNCPEKSGHFRAIGPQLSDILPLQSENARKFADLDPGMVPRQGKNSARRRANVQGLTYLAPADEAPAENTPMTGYPGKLLKKRRRFFEQSSFGAAHGRLLEDDSASRPGNPWLDGPMKKWPDSLRSSCSCRSARKAV